MKVVVGVRGIQGANKAFKGNIGLSGLAPRQDRLSSWEGREPLSRMVGSVRYRCTPDRRRPLWPRTSEQVRKFAGITTHGAPDAGDSRVATATANLRRIPARINASSTWETAGQRSLDR